MEYTPQLSDYYRRKYPEPRSEQKKIDQLVTVHKELFGAGKTTLAIADGIAEQYRLIQSRALPAYEWMLEAMYVASKKEEGKKNFPYVVGMLRQWMKFGFGHLPTREEDEIVDYFEEVIDMKITQEARTIIKHLMGRFGAIKVTRMVGSINNPMDIPKAKAMLLQLLLEDKFGSVEFGEE